MGIFEYNGGAVVAMTGKDCVAIATDKRFGIQFQTIGMENEKCFRMGKQLFLGLTGLSTDISTVHERLKFRMNRYELQENREIKPITFMNMISNLLYEHRFGPYFVGPIVAGLDPKTSQPYVASLDLIGCSSESEDFVVSGTCTEQLYGMCETLWEPNMSSDQLFECVSQSILNAVDRDAISGWGISVYIIEKDKVTKKELKARMD